MQRPFESCRLKLERAKEHIDGIDGLVKTGLVTTPSDPVRVAYAETDTGDRLLVFFFDGLAPDLPPRLSILAGEAVHQMRSVLDHLIWELIFIKTTKPPNFHSAFPIVGTGRMGKRGWQTASEAYESQTSRLKDVIPPKTLALVEHLQPFHVGASYKSDRLWMLQELDNTDKHRLLLMTVHGVRLYKANIFRNGEPFEDVCFRFDPAVRFEDGAEFGRIPFTGPPFVDAEMKVKADIIFAPAFEGIGDTKDIPVIPCLHMLLSEVRNILSNFTRIVLNP